MKSSTSSSTTICSVEGAFEKYRIHKTPGDPTRREFTYFMLGGGRLIYASTARLALIKVLIQVVHYTIIIVILSEFPLLLNQF